MTVGDYIDEARAGLAGLDVYDLVAVLAVAAAGAAVGWLLTALAWRAERREHRHTRSVLAVTQRAAGLAHLTPERYVVAAEDRGRRRRCDLAS